MAYSKSKCYQHVRHKIHVNIRVILDLNLRLKIRALFSYH